MGVVQSIEMISLSSSLVGYKYYEVGSQYHLNEIVLNSDDDPLSMVIDNDLLCST